MLKNACDAYLNQSTITRGTDVIRYLFVASRTEKQNNELIRHKAPMTNELFRIDCFYEAFNKLLRDFFKLPSKQLSYVMGRKLNKSVKRTGTRSVNIVGK